ncbi:MAG: hypothetical protein H8E37_05740 [Planctomycetes bacterium]|nr:hypothetical protein [Planctomycetota bacterium]
MLAVQCLLARLAFLPPQVRVGAVQKLAVAGSPKAAGALLRVLELQDQVVHQGAVTSLATVGPALLKPAMEHLRSGDPKRQLAGAEALGVLKSGAAGALPALLESLNSPGSEV